MARLLLLGQQKWAWPALLCLVIGGFVAQIVLALLPEAGLPVAFGAGIKAALVSWAALTAADVARAVIYGQACRSVSDDTATVHLSVPRHGGAALAHPASVRRLPRLTTWHITGVTAMLIAAALQRAPSRLVVNLLGYGLVAVPVLWVVQWRAGPRAATKAAAVLALFAFFPTHVNLPTAPVRQAWRADSAFRWTVGWPREGWVLRHEIQLDRPAQAQPMLLTIRLAGPYRGPGRIVATLNGQKLGVLRHPDRGILHGRLYDVLQVEIPARLVAGQSRLTFELRQQPVDPSLRIVAQRWAAGATLGFAASSFYDGQHWWLGTFNDLLRRRQPGVYVLELRSGS